jgi:primary-amine oxidase
MTNRLTAAAAVLLASTAMAQPAQNVITRALEPSTDDLSRLNLVVAWRLYLPVENRADAIATVQPVDDQVFVQLDSGRLVAIQAHANPKTFKRPGDVLWTFRPPQRPGAIQPLAVGPSEVYVVQGQRLLILDRTDGKVKYTEDMAATATNGPVSDDTSIYIPLSTRKVVDLNEMKVIRVEEYGHWPLPPVTANYSADRVPNQRNDIKPLDIAQPEGPSFTVDGYAVKWQNWSFTIGFNAREGLTLHHLRYNDRGKDRSVLYRASLTEMVVPYGDPAPTQYRKNAFDVGEYGMGMCANSLELGCDCLGLIRYFDAHLCTSRGEPLTVKNAICMHEEDYGILWKHTDRRLPDRPEVRRSRRLVVSSISTVENYEYGFFWYLYQDGNIQFEIKLTGILSLGALQPGESSPYGALIAPQLYAPNHQHFFNVRLDFDLDGVANSIYQIDVMPDEPGPKNPHNNAFSARPTLLKSEKQARAQLDLRTARTWKIVNRSKKNVVGEPVGYKFLPGDNSFPMGGPEAWWRKRAGFVNYHVWVTPFNEAERFGAGDYPNQSRGGDGLIKWTEADRPIDDTDVVLWYTFGHTHIPRPEDYPAMPTAYIGFMLKPNGFFDMNPANDVPPSPKKEAKGACCH